MTRVEELDIYARTIWAESRGEPLAGQIAVAGAILNRVRDDRKRWPATIADVCRQPKQFSCWNTPRTKTEKATRLALDAISFSDKAYVRAFGIACGVFMGDWSDHSRGANHYLRTDWMPRVKWWRKMDKTVEIGAHSFFRAA